MNDLRALTQAFESDARSAHDIHLARAFAVGYMAGYLTQQQIDATTKAVREFINERIHQEQTV